jgi:hypothetical protein
VNRLESVLLFHFQKGEVILVTAQKKVRAVREPAKPFQPHMQLVVHPVGRATSGVIYQNLVRGLFYGNGCRREIHSQWKEY